MKERKKYKENFSGETSSKKFPGKTNKQMG